MGAPYRRRSSSTMMRANMKCSQLFPQLSAAAKARPYYSMQEVLVRVWQAESCQPLVVKAANLPTPQERSNNHPTTSSRMNRSAAIEQCGDSQVDTWRNGKPRYMSVSTKKAWLEHRLNSTRDAS